MGKIQVLKSLVIPKFLYRLTNISSNDEVIKEINKVMYSFIWNGKDKIKRLVIINDIENGGLRMTHLETAIQAQKVMILKRYVNNGDRAWKYILDSGFSYGVILMFQNCPSTSQLFIRGFYIPGLL